MLLFPLPRCALECVPQLPPPPPLQRMVLPDVFGCCFVHRGARRFSYTFSESSRFLSVPVLSLYAYSWTSYRHLNMPKWFARSFSAPKNQQNPLGSFFVALTLSSMAQVMCDLVFLNAYSSKISSAKQFWKKSYFWRSVFFIFFASGLPPVAVLTYSPKITKNPKTQVI